jgi:phosphomannomutase
MLKKGKVVVGRDSRPSGNIIIPAVVSALRSLGLNVIDLGIVPTPTVEIAIKKFKAVGGICITASHNPSEWNALKFFNHTGEFITSKEYDRLNKIYEDKKFSTKQHNQIGKLKVDNTVIDFHIKKTLSLETVNLRAVRRKKFKVVVDAINGAGSKALPELLKKMGAQVIEINCKGNGNFVHGAEPVAENLSQLSRAVKKNKADLGMACDPDADRLALVNENGKPIGEELTLTIGVMAVLKKSDGPTVINLSTSKTTEEVAGWFGSKVYYSKVGESNVVQMMRKRKAVIGGEGNGGVIYPSFHAGRDALVAGALTLTLLAEEKISLSKLIETFPEYYNIKSKAPLLNRKLFSKRLIKFEKVAKNIIGPSKINRQDGLRFDFGEGWIQIRTSNTEPIYRLIVETRDQKLSRVISSKVKKYFK